MVRGDECQVEIDAALAPPHALCIPENTVNAT